MFSIERPLGGPPAKLADCRSRGVTSRFMASPLELLNEDGRREWPEVGCGALSGMIWSKLVGTAKEGSRFVTGTAFVSD